MTKLRFFEKIDSLSDDLYDASNAKPYDPDAYNSIVDELDKLHAAHFRRRRLFPWMMLTLLFVLAVFLFLIVVKVLDVIIF